MHHAPEGGFRNPWPGAGEPERGFGAFLKWRLERLRDGGVEPAPAEGSIPVVPGDVARPRAAPDELRITWVGHSTLLLQVGGWNVITDPVWSERASPVAWAGPARLVPPGLDFEALPEIDAVLVSHDHYDHLDRETVLRLHRRFGPRLVWAAPLGFADWFRALGITGVRELDWWQETRLEEAAGAIPSAGPERPPLSLTAAPAQHWSRRSPLERTRHRLWCSWAVQGGEAGAARVYFGGDSGYFPAYPEIGRRLGPFDVVALPIGAYAPRWFMRPAHMDPDEAVRAYRDMARAAGGGARGGVLLPIHWGTFRLTDEPVLEPPRRVQDAWQAAGLPPEDLALLRHGETLVRRPAHG